MAARRYTNKEIVDRQIQHEKDDKREFGDLRRWRVEITKMVNQIHDYMVNQQGVTEGKKETEGKKSGTISIAPEVWTVLKWLILIIGALVGLKLIGGKI